MVPSAPLILHVIGPPFAGKTTYIRQSSNEIPTFDIQQFYRSLGNRGTIEFFSHPLEQRIYILDEQLSKYLTSSHLIIETTGLNQAVNQWLISKKLPIQTLLIWTPFKLIQDRIFKAAVDFGINPTNPSDRKRCFGFDPLELVALWFREYDLGKISYDIRYLSTLCLYIPPLNEVRHPVLYSILAK
ncbi:MAG: hypothetical protein ACTSRS_01190 [Candidatus Helarchaeota archaeon]